jgi:hypothetical protein
MATIIRPYRLAIIQLFYTLFWKNMPFLGWKQSALSEVSMSLGRKDRIGSALVEKI